MPTFTPRLGLTLPLTSENYDISIPNGNFSILDSAPSSAVICTSSTQPSSPTDGDIIFESDSSNIKVRHSSTWKAANGKFFLCTSGTRPASGLTYGGFPIFETDTGNRLIRNAANTDWIPQSPYRVADSSALAALTGVPNGFLAIVDSTNEFYMRYFTIWAYAQMPAVHNRGAPGFGTSTSLSYTQTISSGGVIGAAFTAPIGGRVEITNGMYMWNSSAAQASYCSFRIGTGATVGAGTQVVAPDDLFAIITNGVNAATFGRTVVVTGLTSGSVYNVQQRIRVSGATGSFNFCDVTVNGA